MDDIRDLLQSAERPRELRDDEQARLRARLGIDEDAVVQPLRQDSEDGSPPVWWRRPEVRWAVLGAAAVLVAVIAFSNRGSTPDTLETDVPTPTVEVPNPVAQVCGAELIELIDALEQWRGVDAWNLTTNGTPDVGALTLDTLRAVALVPGLEDRAGPAAVELEPALDLDALGPTRGALARRGTAVHDALTVLDELLRETDTTNVCPLNRLTAAR